MIEKLMERKHKVEKELVMLLKIENKNTNLDLQIRQKKAELNNIIFQLSQVNKVKIFEFCYG